MSALRGLSVEHGFVLEKLDKLLTLLWLHLSEVALGDADAVAASRRSGILERVWVRAAELVAFQDVQYLADAGFRRRGWVCLGSLFSLLP